MCDSAAIIQNDDDTTTSGEDRSAEWALCEIWMARPMRAATEIDGYETKAFSHLSGSRQLVQRLRSAVRVSK